ncbi:MAG: DUF1592 domain-containing protein, partial [Planctomycetota bacterium]
RRDDWINVIQQIKLRSMPPADSEQPTDDERRSAASWLTETIENFDYDSVREPGFEPARRLTHEEYNHTIRDLVGTDLRPADRFPADMTASSGFENSANSLFLQPITLERYIGAAEAIVNEAWPEVPTTDRQRGAWKRLLQGDAVFDAHKVLHQFASRAYRRPATPDEIGRLTDHFKASLRKGTTPRAALRDVLQVILISPNFLIRTERDGGKDGQPFRISDWELASRLSYFLWASMPDQELFLLAAKEQLSRPDVLTQQVDRMLDDKRAQTLGTLFAAQWLGFDDLDRVRPGQIDNPWATDSLVAAMHAESALLFHSLIRDDQSLDVLLTADFTYLNQELARHYGIEGVEGESMRRVSLSNTERRGLLGHGSVLAVTSFPGRTSPVLRGHWILSDLLGTPPPPPPPNVSEFAAAIAESERLTQRQKLELHRRNPNCYACHSQMDPLGLALSRYDWFGRYRPRARGRAVDASGQFPDGTTIDGLSDLSETLVGRRSEDLSRQLIRKMLSYALGRQLNYHDEATVRDLIDGLRQDDHRIRSLVHGIVQSDAFQMKQRTRSDP